jgi:hypothetical protein
MAGGLPTGALVANLVWAGVNLSLAQAVLGFTARLSRFQRSDYRFPRSLDTRNESGRFEVVAKVDGVYTRRVHPTHPFDAIGSRDEYLPYKFAVEDVRPLVADRSHVPPSGHTIFRLPGCYLLDLPGYGFARTSRTARAAYRALLSGVVSRRPSLTGVVWLLDARHPPSADDREIRLLLAESGRGVLPVLTKADKLTRNGQAEALRDRAGELGMAADELLLTSATTGLGMDELAEAILDTVASR